MLGKATQGQHQSSAQVLTAARVALGAAAAFLVLLTALHGLEPEFDPSWRMVSEYELGRYGWLMTLAFLCLATCCLAVWVALRGSQSSRLGAALLLLNALGMTMGAVFITDPITAAQDAMTTHGHLHGWGGMIVILSFPLAASLMSRSLARNPMWAMARPALGWLAVLAWVSLAVFIVSLGTGLGSHQGVFGPSVQIGWPNRVLIVVYSLWLMTVAWNALRVQRTGA